MIKTSFQLNHEIQRLSKRVVYKRKAEDQVKLDCAIAQCQKLLEAKQKEEDEIQAIVKELEQESIVHHWEATKAKEELRIMGEDEWFFSTVMKQHPHAPYGGGKVNRYISKKDIPQLFKSYFLGWDLSEMELNDLWNKSEGGRGDLLSQLMEQLVDSKEKDI